MKLTQMAALLICSTLVGIGAADAQRGGSGDRNRGGNTGATSNTGAAKQPNRVVAPTDRPKNVAKEKAPKKQSKKEKDCLASANRCEARCAKGARYGQANSLNDCLNQTCTSGFNRCMGRQQ